MNLIDIGTDKIVKKKKSLFPVSVLIHVTKWKITSRYKI